MAQHIVTREYVEQLQTLAVETGDQSVREMAATAQAVCEWDETRARVCIHCGNPESMTTACTRSAAHQFEHYEPFRACWVGPRVREILAQ